MACLKKQLIKVLNCSLHKGFNCLTASNVHYPIGTIKEPLRTYEKRFQIIYQLPISEIDLTTDLLADRGGFAPNAVNYTFRHMHIRA